MERDASRESGHKVSLKDGGVSKEFCACVGLHPKKGMSVCQAPVASRRSYWLQGPPPVTQKPQLFVPGNEEPRVGFVRTCPCASLAFMVPLGEEASPRWEVGSWVPCSWRCFEDTFIKTF